MATGGDQHQRGPDAGLARTIPTDFDGRAGSYRDYFRRLALFQRLCGRRGPDCEAEGALTLLQRLFGKAWYATKDLDLKAVGRFRFDFEGSPPDVSLRRYGRGQARWAEVFEKFARPSDDEIFSEYEIRELGVRTRLRDVGVIDPDLVAAWLALCRTGVPHWQEPKLGPVCRGNLTPRRCSRL